jgi:competence protein ComEC
MVAAAGWWVRAGARMPRRAVLAAGVALALFTWSGALAAGPPRAFTVVFFDVGQGDAALIRSPAGAAILIDGGPDPDQVATKLAALGVHRLDLVVATHPHADHVAGLPAVLARVSVGLVIDPGCHGDSPFYAQFLRAVGAAGVPFRHPRPGDVLRVGDIRLDVLGPEHCFSGTNSDPNNDSLILRVTDGPASIMFPGDAEQPGQTDVLRDEPGLLHALVLKVPHHGGDTSLDAFIKAIGARLAVVSVGPNRYGHPVPRVLAELAHDGMRVYRTDRSGDVTVTFDGATVSVQSRHA